MFDYEFLLFFLSEFHVRSSICMSRICQWWISLKVIWIFHGAVHKDKYLYFLPQASQFFLQGLLYSPTWCVNNEAWNILIIVWGEIQPFWRLRFLPTAAGVTGYPLAKDQRRRCEGLFHKHVQLTFRSFLIPWVPKFSQGSKTWAVLLFVYLPLTLLHSLSPLLDY